MSKKIEQNPITSSVSTEIIDSADKLGVKAYAILHSEPFDAFDVVGNLNEMPEVTQANVCLDYWNIVAILNTQTMRELGEVYHGKILQIPKIVDRKELIIVT